MRAVRVQPPELGVVDGLAYARFRPAGEPAGGVVVLHGAGSCKESHFDFARLCRGAGLDAIAFDQRGHGDSAGALGAGAVDDVGRVAALLGPGPVALRGSSMGGFMALVAGARLGAAAVVAICPAASEQLRRGLRDGGFDFRADARALDALLELSDERAAAAALGERLLLLHAEGDERVPVAGSRELHALAAGSRLVTVPGGHHRSVQHDGELQALAVRFITRALAMRRAPGPTPHGAGPAGSPPAPPPPAG
ncbi:MAG: alpha/beta hydrolase [Solirubrobacteraceae bacterium]